MGASRSIEILARDQRVNTCLSMSVNDLPGGLQAVLDREGVELQSDTESVADSTRDTEKGDGGPVRLVPGEQDRASLLQLNPLVSIASYAAVSDTMGDKACDWESLSPEELKLKQDARGLKLVSLVATTNAEKAIYRQRTSAVRTMVMLETLIQARNQGIDTPEDKQKELVLLRREWRENDKNNAFLRMAERVGYNEAERQCAMGQDDTELSEWNTTCTVRHNL